MCSCEKFHQVGINKLVTYFNQPKTSYFLSKFWVHPVQTYFDSSTPSSVMFLKTSIVALYDASYA